MTTKASNVAISGAIMPAPLAKPAIRASPRAASAVFGRVSVVMMDLAKASDPSGDSAFIAESIPSRTFSMSNGTPMMPVEFTSTFSFAIDIARAVCSAIARASA